MSIKIIIDPKDYDNALLGEVILIDDIKKLKKNHHRIMRKRKRRDTDDTIDIEELKDTKCVWFSQNDINQLFSDNSKNDPAGTYGLRIYLGLYDKDDPIRRNPNQHDKKETVILVVTKDTGKGVHKDQLKKDNFVNIGGYDYEGMNHGELCTPHCNGTLI